MKNNLFIVDGSGYIYRSYFAVKSLRNQKGEPTNALFGVVNMMRKLPSKYPADHYICVFDAKGPTFRDKLYPDYKANRPSMEDDLRFQMEQIHEIVRAMGWTVIIESGVEADDVIASLAEKAKALGKTVLISTADKDLTQLVDEQVVIVDTMKDQCLDVDGVFNKFGVYPSQMVDYLMLLGDASDNIPGVKGVGPKTATKWLNQYGSLDQIIAHIDQIKGKVALHLKEALGQFDLTRKLVTIKRDHPLERYDFIFNEPQKRTLDEDRLIELFTRFEFSRFLKEVKEIQNSREKPLLLGAKFLKDSSPKVSEDLETILTSQETASSCKPTGIETTYQTVLTFEALNECVRQIQASDYVVIDTETTDVLWSHARLVGLSMSVRSGQAWYIPLRHCCEKSIQEDALQGDLFSTKNSNELRKQYVFDDSQLPILEVLSILKPILEDKTQKKIFHNAKYDLHVLANEGIEVKGVTHDTLLMAYVLDSSQKLSLESLSRQYLGREGLSYEDLCGKGVNKKTIDQVPIDQVSIYACEDADFTLSLFEKFYPLVQSNPIYDLEMQLLLILYRMERYGVLIDDRNLLLQSQELAAKMTDLERDIFNAAGEVFNLNSPKQVGDIFYNKLGYPVLSKTHSGKPSTDEETLSQLAQTYPVARDLLEYRGLMKLKSTYTDKLVQIMDPNTHRVHTNYGQAMVFTGRLASSDPNLQNIPIKTAMGRRVREAFIAPENCHLISADYSQIELRLMAHVSDDPLMKKAFLNGEDIHSTTASEVFHIPLNQVNAEHRRAAKAINFGLIYGMGAFGLAKNLHCSREEANEYIERYFARYSRVKDYMAYIKSQVLEQGYADTVFGRRLYFKHSGTGASRKSLERQAINAPIQGSAADLIKKAMIRVQGWLDQQSCDAHMILQVHDELVLEVSDSAIEQVSKKLPQLMCAVVELNIPLEAQVGRGLNWLEAH